MVMPMVFNAYFNYIVQVSFTLLVEETGEKPIICHWQTLSHNVVLHNTMYVDIVTSLVSIENDMSYDKVN